MEKKTHNLFIIANISAFFRSYMHKITQDTFLLTQNRLKNKTLYTLLRTNFAYQGGRVFKCPKKFLDVVNERVLMVAEI